MLYVGMILPIVFFLIYQASYTVLTEPGRLDAVLISFIVSIVPTLVLFVLAFRKYIKVRPSEP